MTVVTACCESTADEAISRSADIAAWMARGSIIDVRFEGSNVKIVRRDGNIVGKANIPRDVWDTMKEEGLVASGTFCVPKGVSAQLTAKGQMTARIAEGIHRRRAPAAA